VKTRFSIFSILVILVVLSGCVTNPPPVRQTVVPISQGINAKQEDKVYEDGRIGIILDKVERSDDYPSEWKVAGNQYLPPKKGQDYIVVYFTIAIIKNIHVVNFGGRGDEMSSLYDAKGQRYKLAHWSSKGWEYVYPDKGFESPIELVQGAKGILIFVFPEKVQPTGLSFVYYFKVTWEDKTKRAGKIDIMLPKLVEQN